MLESMKVRRTSCSVHSSRPGMMRASNCSRLRGINMELRTRAAAVLPWATRNDIMPWRSV